MTRETAIRGTGREKAVLCAGVRCSTLPSVAGERMSVRQASVFTSSASRSAPYLSDLSDAHTGGENSTPGFRIEPGSSTRFAADRAWPNKSGRCASYQGMWSRPTA